MKPKVSSYQLNLLKEAIRDSYYSLISPKIIIPIIFIPLFLFFAIDTWGIGAFANTFDDVKMLFPFISTKENEPDPIFECYVNGQKYKVSEEVCDDIRKNANVDQEANVKAPTPTKAVQKVVNYPTSTPDPDPLVKCLIHSDCGGGSRLLKSSVCNQSTCCQIGNLWIFYESSTKCDQDQDAYYSQNKYVPPTNAPLPTWAPFATWASLPTIDYSNYQYEYEYIVPTKDPAQCKREVRDRGYDTHSIERFCVNLLAPRNAVDSSAYDECIRAKERERDILMAGCGD
ncbi:MAG: hypothetical protein Q8P72_02720 [Candidatus Roizmanbacteria bacterium]|nr:hypothetical protein [Candidatus Roizmanbacteria bacterium]